MTWHVLASDFLRVGKALPATLELLGGGLAIGVVLGTLLSVFRRNRAAAVFVKAWVSVLRGTPIILQLSLMYFTVPVLIGVKMSVIFCGVLTFGLNSSAYVAEIIRVGIESLPKGQFEAAKVLGVPQRYMWKDIIFPQVFRNVLPALINEVVSLLKETALIGVISGLDIMRSAQLLGAQRFEYFTPLCIAGVYYYALVLVIEYTGKKLEGKFSYVRS